MDLFKQSIAIDPDNAAESYNYLGYLWADQNTHLEEAEEYIKRALGADPDNGAYLDSFGWLHYRQGKYEQAIAELLNAARVLKEDDPTVFEHIGDTYTAMNQEAKALEYWQKALALDPTNKGLATKIAQAKSGVSKTEPASATPIK